MTVRYGARAPEQRRNREVEATSAKIWSEALTAVWETDPEVIAAVLPPPLAPIEGEPLVRCTITIVQMPGGGPTFGAGWLGVRARHGDEVGEYPIFMPMTTEQSVIGGRETYGEPKKIADVWSRRTPDPDGDLVEGVIARFGRPLIEIRGRVSETREPYELAKRDFWFKFLPAADGNGLEDDGVLVYGEKTESARLHLGVTGEVVLHESAVDPVADLVVRRMVDISWTERASTQVGRTVARVPAADLLPYVHQRYDDLSVLGKGAD